MAVAGGLIEIQNFWSQAAEKGPRHGEFEREEARRDSGGPQRALAAMQSGGPAVGLPHYCNFSLPRFTC